MIAILHSPLAHAVFLAWVGGAGADITALVGQGKVRGWVALKDFDWNIASFRWLTAAGAGLLAGLGINLGGLA